MENRGALAQACNPPEHGMTTCAAAVKFFAPLSFKKADGFGQRPRFSWWNLL